MGHYVGMHCTAGNFSLSDLINRSMPSSRLMDIYSSDAVLEIW